MVLPQKDAEKGFQSLCGLQSQTKCLGGPLLTTETKSSESWEFPGGPVVRTPGQRSKIQQASQPKPKEKQTNKQKEISRNILQGPSNLKMGNLKILGKIQLVKSWEFWRVP